jgi:hypothetical protein
MEFFLFTILKVGAIKYGKRNLRDHSCFSHRNGGFHNAYATIAERTESSQKLISLKGISKMAGVFYATLLIFIMGTIAFIWVLRQLRQQDQERSRK